MKHKDVFQILPLNMKHNPLCTCKNCIKNASSTSKNSKKNSAKT